MEKFKKEDAKRAEAVASLVVTSTYATMFSRLAGVFILPGDLFSTLGYIVAVLVLGRPIYLLSSWVCLRVLIYNKKFSRLECAEDYKAERLSLVNCSLAAVLFGGWAALGIIIYFVALKLRLV